MSNQYSVSACAYDGTSGAENPLVGIVGTVNGFRVYPIAFFRYLDAANVSGQMQSALSAILFNWYVFAYGFQQLPWPTPIALPIFPASNAVAEFTKGVYPVPQVSYQAALIGSWSA
jgi:hypothetical protein